MSKTLYISDLDGTLLGPDTQLSQTTVTLLNHAISRGALISVATARTPATVSHLLRDVNFRLPLVVMTGAALWDKQTGVYSEVQHFTPEQVERIAGIYRSVPGGEGFLYTLAPRRDGHDMMEIYHIGSLNGPEREFMEERLSSPFKTFLVPESGDSDIPSGVGNAVLFFGMNEVPAARKIYEALQSVPKINPMYYHDWHGDKVASVEAFPQSATKALAIRRLAAKVGADRIVVFGDNVNDLSMMQVASWSVAVEGALPEVKLAADEVIGPNGADAVARYILEDLEINRS